MYTQRFLNSLYMRGIKTHSCILFSANFLREKDRIVCHVRELVSSISLSLYYKATHFPISAHRFRAGRILPSIRATAIVYANIMQERRRDCSICLCVMFRERLMQITRRMQIVTVDLMRACSHACPRRFTVGSFVRFILAFAIRQSTNVIDRQSRISIIIIAKIYYRGDESK